MNKKEKYWMINILKITPPDLNAHIYLDMFIINLNYSIFIDLHTNCSKGETRTLHLNINYTLSQIAKK